MMHRGLLNVPVLRYLFSCSFMAAYSTGRVENVALEISTMQVFKSSLEHHHHLIQSKLELTTPFCVLASKTKKQIFVSYNLQNTDSSFTLLIENRIKEEMMAFPEKF